MKLNLLDWRASNSFPLSYRHQPFGILENIQISALLLSSCFTLETLFNLLELLLSHQFASQNGYADPTGLVYMNVFYVLDVFYKLRKLIGSKATDSRLVIQCISVTYKVESQASTSFSSVLRQIPEQNRIEY